MTKKKIRKLKASESATVASGSGNAGGKRGAGDVKPASHGHHEKKVSRLAAFRQFLQDVGREFERISWPGRKETKGLTVAVFAITIFFTVYLGFVDVLLSELVSMLMNS